MNRGIVHNHHWRKKKESHVNNSFFIICTGVSELSLSIIILNLICGVLHKVLHPPLSDQKIDTCKNFVFKKEACIRQRNVLSFFHVLFDPRVWIMIAGTDTDDNDNKDKGFDNDVFNYS